MHQNQWNKASEGTGQKAGFAIAKPVYRLENLSVSFGKIGALKSVNLTVESGEFIFITGPSGAGKTTLLRIFAEEIGPSSGRIESIRKSDPSFFVNTVFQDLRLIGRQTCETNLNYSYDPAIYQTRTEFENDKAELCRIFGVDDRLYLKINEANGGLKQKIAIIRSLLGRPNVLLADEPTSSLDSENAKKLFDVLQVYNLKRGMTVIWSTHNRELIKKFNGRILHLDSGKLVYSGHACFM